MDDLEDESALAQVDERAKSITSGLFASYLACPTKCYLQAAGEIGRDNDYSNWLHHQRRSYERMGIDRLSAIYGSELGVSVPDGGSWKGVSWRFAYSLIVRVQNFASDLHIERIPPKGTKDSSQFVPIRFVPSNKLSRFDKLLVAFDALVLAKASGLKVDVAKIIHGDNWTITKVKANALSRKIRQVVGKIDDMLLGNTPPPLILNRHCSECEFQSRCRKLVIEKDDLTLLANLPDKERLRLNRKGIFTVAQLSYTFRPRRRYKRLAAKAEKYHHSLQALAIREGKIHVVGNPSFGIEGTPVFLDVEGIPDRDFYYLIGMRFDIDDHPERHSLWADSLADEGRIWKGFLDVLSKITNPMLIHYGSFEATFIKRMCARYGGPVESSSCSEVISSTINLLSVIFSQIYFPSYSNGLKEIAQYLGFKWSDRSASGLMSIVWCHCWEETQDSTFRERLVSYNMDDCEALGVVARAVARICQAASPGKTEEAGSNIVHAESLGKNLSSKWRVFKSSIVDLEKINGAAHWHYQRDRVFVRSGIPKRKTVSKSHVRKANKKASLVIVVQPSDSCPNCSKRGRIKSRLFTRTVQDLIFGRRSIKGRSVKYVFQTYRCRGCGHEDKIPDWYRAGTRKWGWNMVAYFVYHTVGLRIPQLTIQHSMNRLFGFNVVRSTLGNLKFKASEYYSVTKRKILNRIVHGSLIHADETRANIKGHLAYVWVLTNLSEVVFILAESREREVIQTLLSDFKGVLVSDFYAAYDGFICPQQKCLIHLMRDLNEEILNNPFDDGMKAIAMKFGTLLRPMVETIDRHGLKRHFLRKHLVEVDRFYEFLDRSDCKSEAASKCKQRFQKNRDKLFTFLNYDGVPWNNNNAEHAIKAFARLSSPW